MTGRQRRQGPSHSTLATPPCAGDVKNNEVPPAQRKKTIDEGAAMLLYEAPSGIAIFSFDGAYLENPVKDFWSDLPQLSLEFFLKYKRVSTPFDLDNGTIDNFLAKRLTKLCGPKRKLAVGGAEHNKGIIEVKLGITCLYVGVPDTEVISCSLKNPCHTLLTEEKSETSKSSCLPSGKELRKFSCQYKYHVEPEMFDETIVELTGLLHGIELREIEHLKFLHILLKDFLILSGIGTKNWSLIELATLLKMICYREASYKGRYPYKIFSDDECQRIEVNVPRYKTSFSRIDVLSVYEDVISLDIAKDILSFKLDFFVENAKKVAEMAEAIILPTGSKVRKEGSTNVDDRLNSIAEDNWGEATLVKDKLDFSSEKPQQDVKKTLTILEETPSMDKSNDFCNEEICNKEDDRCLIPGNVQEELSEDNVEENNQALDIGVQNRDANEKRLTENKQDGELHATSARLNSRLGKQNEVIPTTRARLKSGPPKVLFAEETESEETDSTKSWAMSVGWQMFKRGLPAVRSRSPSAGLGFPAKKSHEKTDRRSKVMKLTCMGFICCYSVQCWFGFACQDVSQEY